MSMISHSELMYAAYFMEGLRDADYDKMLEAWDRGCIELVSQIVMYAPVVQQMVDAADKALDHDCSWPGVFDYEVCNPFGKWIADHILATKDMPSREACREWLAEAVIAFFNQSPNTDKRSEVEAAVRAVITAPVLL